MKGHGVTTEQLSLLNDNSHSLKPLTIGGRLGVCQMFQFTLLPLGIYVFTLLCLVYGPRFLSGTALQVVLALGLAIPLAAPTVALAIFSFGVITTHVYSSVRWPAVNYWSFWPFWKCVLCWVAAYVAFQFGHAIYYQKVLPYDQMERLQTYHGMGVASAGSRLQDAGIVEFNASAGVDRARTGCIKNGHIYCVAPIVQGEELALRGTPKGHHDLFMAGVDCCTCPGEFRCGNWNKPTKKIGGMRILSSTDIDFYRLAVQDWSMTYQLSAEQPVFFEWIDGPEEAWAALSLRARQLLLVELIMAPFVLMALVYVLNGFFGFLQSIGRAVPINPPLPPKEGFGHAMSKRLHPQMHSDHEERQAQLGTSMNGYSAAHGY